MPFVSDTVTVPGLSQTTYTTIRFPEVFALGNARLAVVPLVAARCESDGRGKDDGGGEGNVASGSGNQRFHFEPPLPSPALLRRGHDHP